MASRRSIGSVATVDGGDPSACSDCAGNGRRSGALPRRWFRRLPHEAGRHPGPRQGGQAALRGGTPLSTNGRAKILVVDDVPENVRLLEAVLAPRGYDVLPAYGGVAALDLVERESPDLVLLDVLMPDLDGYAVCERLRERESTAVLPVIMV